MNALHHAHPYDRGLHRIADLRRRAAAEGRARALVEERRRREQRERTEGQARRFRDRWVRAA